MTARAPRALFLSCGFAGHRPWFSVLRREVERDGRLDARFELVSGWREGGLLERTPLLPNSIRSQARMVTEMSSIASLPRPDVIWTSAPAPVLLPFLWSFAGPLARPFVIQFDWTREQQEAMAPFYFHRAPRPPGLIRVGSTIDRFVLDRMSFVAPWSEWAADSLRAMGVPSERIRIHPPGVDTERWTASTDRWRTLEGKLRLVFVGGDFERKGGMLLLEAMRTGLADRAELDIVTRDAVPEAPGVRVHRAEPGDPLLASLLGSAHVFVMPSLAECFGIATIEAMASGIPTLVSNVGAFGEIVEDGMSGWLVDPTAAGVREGLERVLASRTALPAMGARGRAIVEARFDAGVRARALVDLLLEAHERHSSAT